MTLTVPRRTRVAAVAGALLAAVAVLALALPARAADPGAGFGTWAPLSSTGWHGSVSFGGIHTYCIAPGLPAPTGGSSDLGIRADAGGLSPQQLTGINLLVTRHGQTDDAARAAAVGWAVKAIADREETLHAWGYPGDSLADAVRWSLSRVAPAHADAVAALAETYYAEGSTVTAPAADGRVTLTTDSGDPRLGTVHLDGGAGTEATIRLENAVFRGSDDTELTTAPSGVDLPIEVVPATDGSPVTVRASATFRAEFAPAVRLISTPGQQDTAGPGGGIEYVVDTADAAPRPARFSPVLTTEVVDAAAGEHFQDDVTVQTESEPWPLALDGTFVPITATATVYRTDVAAADLLDAPPADATPVGELSLTTDGDTGPATYRVTSDWTLPGPGTYTAVWSIDAAAQPEETVPHLAPGYVWNERFGVPSQMLVLDAPSPTPTSETTPSAEPAESAAPTALAATGPTAQTPRLLAGGFAAGVLGAGLLAHAIAAHRRRQRI